MQSGVFGWAGSTIWLIIGVWLLVLGLLLPFVVFRIKDQLNKLITITQAMQSQLAAIRKVLEQQQQLAETTNILLRSSYPERSKNPEGSHRAVFHIDEG